MITGHSELGLFQGLCVTLRKDIADVLRSLLMTGPFSHLYPFVPLRHFPTLAGAVYHLHTNIDQATQNLFNTRTYEVSSTSEDLFGSQNIMGKEWQFTSSSSRDTTFGFNVLPVVTWSTCFPNLLAEDESTIPSTTPQMTYTGTALAQSSPNSLASSTYQHDHLLDTCSDVPFRSSDFAGGMRYDPVNEDFGDTDTAEGSMVSFR